MLDWQVTIINNGKLIETKRLIGPNARTILDWQVTRTKITNNK
jgi:hypothetical protein